MCSRALNYFITTTIRRGLAPDSEHVAMTDNEASGKGSIFEKL